MSFNVHRVDCGDHRFSRTGVVAEECFKQPSEVNKVNLIFLIVSGHFSVQS